MIDMKAYHEESPKLAKLVEVLSDFQSIYRRLLNIEERKRQAVLNEDLPTLREATSEQEQEVADLEQLDQQRQGLLEDLALAYEQALPGSISEMASWSNVPAESSEKLEEQAAELNPLGANLRALSERNQQLLSDRTNLFASIMELFREQEDSYASELEGRKSNNGRPVFIDANC